jgi:hypothetical protein
MGEVVKDDGLHGGLECDGVHGRGKGLAMNPMDTPVLEKGAEGTTQAHFTEIGTVEVFSEAIQK